jgi:hypothetical protein
MTLMNESPKRTFTKTQIMVLLADYTSKKIGAQIKTIAFVVFYLIGFQLLILGLPVSHPITIFWGIVSVIIGLAFFLEGLFLSVMPLAETAGAELPVRTPLYTTLGVAFVLGGIATLAEPSMIMLQNITDPVPLYQAPLLFYLLNVKTSLFVATIGIGVGTAMILGAVRVIKNLPFKPFVVTCLTIALVASVIAYLDERSRPFVALAWDVGGIATGAVTVPLIIAFGLGISHASAGSSTSTNGLGVVTLANLCPVIAILILSIITRQQIPMPTLTPTEIFEDPRIARLFVDEKAQEDYKLKLTTTLPLTVIPADLTIETKSLKTQLKGALMAVGPLILALAFTLLIFVRKKPPFVDEKILGVVFAFVGILMLNFGLQTGLVPLGHYLGQNISSIIQEPSHDLIEIHNFQPSLISSAITLEGEVHSFFFLENRNKVHKITFDPEAFNPETAIYTIAAEHSPTLLSRGRYGMSLALMIGFFILLGFGTAVAEPTLHALASTLSESTVGSFSKTMLITQAALGVGIGLAVGIIRMLFDIPFLFLLLPFYLLLLLLSLFNDNTYVAVAWDTAGVATGPITVPLVLSFGMGINSMMDSPEQFGLLTMGATIPILIVLLTGARKKINIAKYLSLSRSAL